MTLAIDDPATTVATAKDGAQARLLLRYELQDFLESYANLIDTDQLEEWPKLFLDDCLYEMIPRENEAMDLPAPLLRFTNTMQLRDRVISLREANIFEAVTYRHFISGLTVKERGNSYEIAANYIIVNTSLEGDSSIYQAGRYEGIVLREPEGLRFKQLRAIYDTSRVQTLLAYPA